MIKGKNNDIINIKISPDSVEYDYRLSHRGNDSEVIQQLEDAEGVQERSADSDAPLDSQGVVFIVKPAQYGRVTSFAECDDEIFHVANNAKSVSAVFVALWIIAVIVIFASAEMQVALWIFLGVTLLLITMCVLIIKNARRVVLHYDIDADVGHYIAQRDMALAVLCSCDRVWHEVSSVYTSDKKRNAGASNLVNREMVTITKSNAMQGIQFDQEREIYSISWGSHKYWFLPDRILCIRGDTVENISYSNIDIQIGEFRFIENYCMAGDALLVDQTWRYVNRNGTPDRRFNNNCKLPIYLYANVNISNSSGFSIKLQVSSLDKSRQFRDDYSANEKKHQPITPEKTLKGIRKK